MTAARTRDRVLETLGRADGTALTATDVARRLGVTRSTALRHLDALAREDVRVVERRLPEHGNARSFVLCDDVTTRDGTSPAPETVHAIARALEVEPEDVEVSSAFSGFGLDAVTVPREALERVLGLAEDDAISEQGPIRLSDRAQQALGA